MIKPGTVTAAIASTLDYFPTLAACVRDDPPIELVSGSHCVLAFGSRLSGIPIPTDREYDGVDLTPVLMGKSDTAHTVLFHPNSGASGVNGMLDAVRYQNYKAICAPQLVVCRTWFADHLT